MNLHLDKAAFQLVVDDISKKCSVRRDVLEKDYYVTLLLKELSEREHQAYAYFKGGTALYKALKSIRRFSEIIAEALLASIFTSRCMRSIKRTRYNASAE